VLRVRNLCDEKRAGAVGDVGAETHDEAAAQVHCIPLRGRRRRSKDLQQSAKDNETGSESSASLAAEAVGNIGGEKQDEEAAETRHGTEDTKTTSCRIIEDF
jgi:hypothetical protein